MSKTDTKKSFCEQFDEFNQLISSKMQACNKEKGKFFFAKEASTYHVPCIPEAVEGMLLKNACKREQEMKFTQKLTEQSGQDKIA